MKREDKEEEKEDKEKRGNDSFHVLQPDGFWDYQTQDELRFKLVQMQQEEQRPRVHDTNYYTENSFIQSRPKLFQSNQIYTATKIH